MNTVRRAPKPNTEDIREYSRKHGVSLLTASLLISRGISDEEIETFLNPTFKDLHDPMDFINMPLIAERIRYAVDMSEKITVYGDYDTDGVCAAAIMVKTIAMLGGKAEVYFPDRFTEGYGTNEGAIRSIAESGSKLIITVDCGIKSVEDVEVAKSLGADVIILDHHEPGEVLPDTPYIADAKIEGETYPFKELCGAGVAFKVSSALVGERAYEFADIAAVATIGDIVPLRGENRVIAAEGLKLLSECPNPGLEIVVRDCAGKRGTVNAQTVAFTLAPMLNAAGRLDSAYTAYRLLTESKGLADIALELKSINDRRKSIQQNAVEEAVNSVRTKYKLCDTRVIVVCAKGWNKGIIGLVAARLTEQFNRPSIVFSEEGDVLTGSARSIEGVDLFGALSSVEELFTRFGGHEMAAGLTMPKDNLAKMESRLNAYFKEHYSSNVFLKRYIYDESITERSVNIAVADELACFEPCGHMNPSPIFLWKGAKVENQRFLSDGKHYKLNVSGTPADVMCFNRNEHMNIGDACDFLGEISINEFRGKRNAQFIARIVERKGLFETDEAGEMRAMLKEIRALAKVIENKCEYALEYDEEKFFKAIEKDISADALGTIVIAATRAGREVFAQRDGINALDAIPADTAENAYVLSANGIEALKNYRNIYSAGAFTVADRACKVLFSKKLLENTRDEIARYYSSDERIHAHAKAFASLEVRGYDCISDYLRCAADAAGERSIAPLWLSANIFQELQLLAVKKSDKIFFNYFDGSYDLSQSALYNSAVNALNGVLKELENV